MYYKMILIIAIMVVCFNKSANSYMIPSPRASTRNNVVAATTALPSSSTNLLNFPNFKNCQYKDDRHYDRKELEEFTIYPKDNRQFDFTPHGRDHLIKVLEFECENGMFEWASQTPLNHGYKIKFNLPPYASNNIEESVIHSKRLCLLDLTIKTTLKGDVKAENSAYPSPRRNSKLLFSHKPDYYYSIFTLKNERNSKNKQSASSNVEYLLPGKTNNPSSILQTIPPNNLISIQNNEKNRPICYDFVKKQSENDQDEGFFLTSSEFAIYLDNNNLRNHHPTTTKTIPGKLDLVNPPPFYKFAYHVQDIKPPKFYDQQGCGKCTEQQLIFSFCTNSIVMKGKVLAIYDNDKEFTKNYEIKIQNPIFINGNKDETTTTPDGDSVLEGHIYMDDIHGCNPPNIGSDMLFIGEKRFGGDVNGNGGSYVTCALSIREWQSFLANNRRLVEQSPCPLNI